jgi:hypothetical protein
MRPPQSGLVQVGLQEVSLDRSLGNALALVNPRDFYGWEKQD